MRTASGPTQPGSAMRPRGVRRIPAPFLVLMLVALAGCEQLDPMISQQKVKPYRESEFWPDRISMRPVTGRGQIRSGFGELARRIASAPVVILDGFPGVLWEHFRKRLAAIAKVDLVVIDDFAIAPIGARERTDLLEVLDDRVGTRSTLLTSQLPIEHWHEYIGDPTLADAILDRLVHSAHKIHLEGESMRKRAANSKTGIPNKTTSAP